MIEYGKVFTITKGKHTARWKVIEHPFVEGYAIIKDYCGLYGNMNSQYRQEDEQHIVGWAFGLDEAYHTAYDMT